ncbi:hypothetical protein X474_07445 [Dethiosulfatarculus sandiegensis]|uniref:Uncharacterized protein n=2 Tax=Dethiosulfatarculus sandiegensis TaxID=1429043 RepID=A0A0D2J980_9BACT|nr:hypothetical protein X474_07445 [Dethiosulfatarculus sandiegensis]
MGGSKMDKNYGQVKNKNSKILNYDNKFRNNLIRPNSESAGNLVLNGVINPWGEPSIKNLNNPGTENAASTFSKLTTYMLTHGATKDVVAKFWEEEAQRANQEGRVWRGRIPDTVQDVEEFRPQSAPKEQATFTRLTKYMANHGATKDVVAKFWEEEAQRAKQGSGIWRGKIPKTEDEVKQINTVATPSGSLENQAQGNQWESGVWRGKIPDAVQSEETQRGNQDGRVWRGKIPSSWSEVEYAIPETAESRQQRKQRLEAPPKNTVWRGEIPSGEKKVDYAKPGPGLIINENLEKMNEGAFHSAGFPKVKPDDDFDFFLKRDINRIIEAQKSGRGKVDLSNGDIISPFTYNILKKGDRIEPRTVRAIIDGLKQFEEVLLKHKEINQGEEILPFIERNFDKGQIKPVGDNHAPVDALRNLYQGSRGGLLTGSKNITTQVHPLPNEIKTTPHDVYGLLRPDYRATYPEMKQNKQPNRLLNQRIEEGSSAGLMQLLNKGYTGRWDPFGMGTYLGRLLCDPNDPYYEVFDYVDTGILLGSALPLAPGVNNFVGGLLGLGIGSAKVYLDKLRKESIGDDPEKSWNDVGYGFD